MTFLVFENLRGFFNSRPPLVVFMICLASFAFALITFAYIVKTKDLPNPDVTEDWNTFLERLSRLKFCMSYNESSTNVSAAVVNVADLSLADAVQSIEEKIIKHHPKSTQIVKRASPEVVSDISDKTHVTSVPYQPVWRQENTYTSQDVLIYQSFHLNVELVASSVPSLSRYKSAHLTADIAGGLLNMKGVYKERHVSMTVSFQTNMSECLESSGRDCVRYLVNACVTLAGPASVLPRVQPSAHNRVCPDLSSGSSSLVRHMSPSLVLVSGQSNWCSHGMVLDVQYSFDESLTVLLSQDDRSMINLHLMRTSYFLFVMVLTLLCYAAIRGRPGKVKTVMYTPVDKMKVFTQS